MNDVRRLAAGCLLASFRGTDAPAWLLRRVEAGLGGVCVYGANVVDPDQLGAVAAAVHRARTGAVVALDEEGGDVTRIDFATGSSWPGNAALGAVDDVALTAGVASEMGEWLAALGFDLDLAPCLDVNSNPANPVIGVRSFGASAALAARHGAAFITALQAAGVAACAKHFPGHGDTAVDSHHGIPRAGADRALLSERELVPFQAAIGAGVASIMTAHVLVPALDPRQVATLSSIVLGEVLREALGFEGAVVSDALDMSAVNDPAHGGIPAAAVAALAAGVDTLCLGSEQDEAALDSVVDAIVAAVEGDRLDVGRLIDAVARTAGLARSPRPQIARADVPAPRGREAAARAISVLGSLPALAGAHVVELRPEASIPAGAVPWGLAGPMQAIDPSITAADLEAGDDPAAAVPAASGRPLVVVTRDAHRHVWPRRALDALAAARPDLVTVELGWPSGTTPPGQAVVHTFGASRVSTDAAAALLLNGRR